MLSISDLSRDSISSERSIFFRSSRGDPLNSDCSRFLVVLRRSELFAEIGFGLLQPGRRYRNLAAHRFLIHQLLENDHLHGAIADLRLHFLGHVAVVLASVGKDGEHLAQQVVIREHRAIDSRHRRPVTARTALSGLSQWLCGRVRCDLRFGGRET